MEPTGPDAVPLQAPEPPGEGIELRQRRPIHKTKSTETNNSQAPTKKKRRLRWVSRHYEMPSEAQTRTFMYMQLRKMRRRVQGRKAKSNIASELCCLCLLIFVMVLLAFFKSIEFETEKSEAPTPSPGNLEPTFAPSSVTAASLTDTGGIVSLLLTIVWILAAFVIISKAPFSPWMRMLKWMLLYIPLVWFIAEWSWTTDALGHYEPFLIYSMVAAEILIFVIFVGFYWVYPMCLKSKRFGFVADSTKYKSAAKFWGVNLVDHWTMTYTSIFMSSQSIQKCKSTHFCKYEGDVDEDTGLPQGVGRWLDDSWEGETITGYWKQGEPVAPFFQLVLRHRRRRGRREGGLLYRHRRSFWQERSQSEKRRQHSYLWRGQRGVQCVGEFLQPLAGSHPYRRTLQGRWIRFSLVLQERHQAVHRGFRPNGNGRVIGRQWHA